MSDQYTSCKKCTYRITTKLEKQDAGSCWHTEHCGHPDLPEDLSPLSVRQAVRKNRRNVLCPMKDAHEKEEATSDKLFGCNCVQTA